MTENTSIPNILKNLQGYVEGVREQHNVPALSVAITFNNKRYSAASGVLNINTGVEATTDSIFQIASITKVFTASLIMQLVDEGKLALDMPVKRYLRDFALADSSFAEKITVAQLLDHTSGIPGDFVGNNSYTEQNAIARYVDRCSGLTTIHPLGERYSYSNAAYNIAGRLIEVMLGTTWFDAIEERIFKPLGMKQSVAHPSQVLKHRAAMGHIRDAEHKDRWQISPDCYFPIAWAPCGSVLTLSASDLITFATVHLNQGKTENGEVWLSPASINLMQQARIKLPPYSYMSSTHCALGWHLTSDNQSTVIGHFGSGPGQKAMLKLVPEHNFAIAALHNSNNAELLPVLLSEVLAHLTSIQLHTVEPTTRRTVPVNLEPLLGTYETIQSVIVISREGSELLMTITPQRQSPHTTERYYLKPVDDYVFLTYNEAGEPALTLSFLDIDKTGKALYLYYMGRLVPKVKDCK